MGVQSGKIQGLSIGTGFWLRDSGEERLVGFHLEGDRTVREHSKWGAFGARGAV